MRWLILCLMLATACTARRMPAGESGERESRAVLGREKYMQFCQSCHPMGEAGLAPALNNNPAPGFIKRFQVRHGLGAMPAFQKDKISSADLNAIMYYLRSMKKKPKLPYS
ncbi:c-type cytochrome [Chitinophaga lutea]